MDGQVIAIIISAVGVSGSIGAGFWKLGRSIGSVEGKVEGLDRRMQGYEKQLEGFDRRLERLGQRINGFFVGREGNG
jgi:hypothetical protein